jgi:hypothetical protein
MTMTSEPGEIAAYVDAVAPLVGMHLAPERKAAVTADLERSAGFAARLMAIELDVATEIAGVFVP